VADAKVQFPTASASTEHGSALGVGRGVEVGDDDGRLAGDGDGDGLYPHLGKQTEPMLSLLAGATAIRSNSLGGVVSTWTLAHDHDDDSNPAAFCIRTHTLQSDLCSSASCKSSGVQREASRMVDPEAPPGAAASVTGTTVSLRTP